MYIPPDMTNITTHLIESTTLFFLVSKNVLWVPPGTSAWSLISILSLRLFLEFYDSIQKHSIKDCFRLGKFNRASRRPRPILVKFVRTADVSRILSKKASLSHRFSIKPDLSPEERLWEAALLKERWNLIQGGMDRKLIKIRNNSILVSGKVHGRVVNSVFQISAPSTQSQTITSHLPTSRSASPSPKSSPPTGPHDTAISLSD